VGGRFGTMPSTSRRRSAAGAAFLWFFGLYALPLLHNIHHRADHTHGPLPHPSHRHVHSGAAVHHADHDRPGHEKDDREPIDSEHGAGSVLHFAVAALGGHAATLPEPGPILAPLEPPPLVRAASIPEILLSVRGPPPR
jgi:hypothetical protein